MPVTHDPNRRFTGVNYYLNPGDVPPGELTQADNVFVSGGELVTRPGLAGRLAAPPAGPMYGPWAYLKPDGSTGLVFTAGGKLYWSDKGSQSFSEILSGGQSFSLDSPNTFAARLGRFLYLVDGSGPLVRTDLTSGAALTALGNPTAAPVASLTNRLINAASDPSKWSTEALPSGSQSNQIPYDPNNPCDGFTILSGQCTVLGPSGTKIAQFDSLDDLMQTGPIANAQTTTAPARYASHVLYSCILHELNGGVAVIVTCIAYSDSGGTTEIGRQSQTLYAPGGFDNEATATCVFDLSGLPSPAASYRIQVGDDPRNVPGTSRGVGVRFSNSHVYAAPLTFAAAGGGVGVSGPTVQTPAGSVAGAVAGQSVTLDLGADTDLSGVNTLRVGYSTGASPVGVGFQVGLRPASGAAAFSNPVKFSADGSYFSVDISTLTAAQRQAVRYLDFRFTADVSFPAAPAGAWLTLGPVFTAGNLSVGFADYKWLFTEVDENGDPTLANVVESGESPASNAVTPTTDRAEGKIVLPAKANASAIRYRLWRQGGTFSDGLWRLVASYRYDGSAGDETNNPYVTWTPAVSTFLDNTPDSFLVGAEVLALGRVPPPVGAQRVCAWQGRLWLAKGSTLYASWLSQNSLGSALYFTSANSGGASSAVEGATFSLGADDNDPIQALVPYGTFLAVLKQKSVWLVGGYDPTNFAAQSYLLDSGVGCVAPRAAGVYLNHIWFLSADGVYRFNGDVVDDASVRLERVLNPHGDTGEAVQVSAAYRQSWLRVHDRRLYLGVPTPGDAAPTVAFLHDSRTDGWTRLLGFSVTGAASLSSGTDTDDLFLAGRDGQLYAMQGALDKALPGSPGAAIPFAVTTRGMGQETDGDGFYRRDCPTRAYFYAECDPSQPQAVTLTVAGDDPAAVWTQAYTVTGQASPRFKVPGGMRGYLLTASLAGAATAQVRVRGLALDTVKGQMRA